MKEFRVGQVVYWPFHVVTTKHITHSVTVKEAEVLQDLKLEEDQEAHIHCRISGFDPVFVSLNSTHLYATREEAERESAAMAMAQRKRRS